MATGFTVGAAGVAFSPWPVRGDLMVAVSVGVALGLVEILAVRRFGRARLKQLLLLDGAPFPFASVGLAAAIIVFGLA